MDCIFDCTGEAVVEAIKIFVKDGGISAIYVSCDDAPGIEIIEVSADDPKRPQLMEYWAEIENDPAYESVSWFPCSIHCE